MTKNKLNILLIIFPVVVLTGIHLHSSFINYHEMYKTIFIDRKIKNYREELASKLLDNKYIDVDLLTTKFLENNKEGTFNVQFTQQYSIIFKRVEKRKEVLMVQYPVLKTDSVSGSKTITWKCSGLPYIDMPKDDCRRGLSTLSANRLNFIWK